MKVIWWWVIIIENCLHSDREQRAFGRFVVVCGRRRLQPRPNRFITFLLRLCFQHFVLSALSTVVDIAVSRFFSRTHIRDLLQDFQCLRHAFFFQLSRIWPARNPPGSCPNFNGFLPRLMELAVNSDWNAQNWTQFPVFQPRIVFFQCRFLCMLLLKNPCNNYNNVVVIIDDE